MEKLKIHSGHKLTGRIDICSSKNAILPLLAGSVLCDGVVILNKIPNFSDINKMCEILQSVGANITKQGDILQIDGRVCDKFLISNELGRNLRASILLLGALLSKFRFGVVGYPGGCNIGARPIDLTINGLKSLGVKIVEQHGYLYCDGKNMKPNTIKFEKISVGATENLMLASVFLKGKTVLKNVAKEPEIVDLANFLNSMGAKICGAGTSQITIYGVESLHSTQYTPIADRIIAGTYMVAVAMTGGNVEICNINPFHLKSITKKLAVCGCNIDIKNDKIKVSANDRCRALRSITTSTYPKFPTDMQSAFLSLQTVSKGKCVITENLFEGRFKQVPELIKMGADIKVVCNMATVKGVNKLSGADVVATDLRAGASLVLCGLVADGYTTVYDIKHIDRGYDHIETDLSKLGADIVRIN